MSAATKLPLLQFSTQLREELSRSVIDVLKDGFQLNVQLDGFQLKHKVEIKADLSGLVGLIDDHEVGQLLISFDRESLAQILRKVYDDEFSQVTETMKQGLAELTNIIHGNFKAKVNGRGHNLKMCLPTVVASPSHQIDAPPPAVSGVFQFRLSSGGTFQVTLTLIHG